MKKVQVVTDSTAYIPQQQLAKYNIEVVPLNVIWDNQTYRDGVDITPQNFYQRLQKSKTLPSTSQPSAAAFKSIFKKNLEEDREIIAILISSEISGTVNSALQAKQELGENQIQIVDSRTAAMAAGLQVLTVARAAAAGASLAECHAQALKAQHHTDVIFVVDTLEFLHRGGRIGGAKRLFGSMLNIKPILEMREGKIEPLDQVRTQSKAIERMLAIMKERIGEERPVQIAGFHSNAPLLAENLLEKACDQFEIRDSYLTELSPVIGTHVGPGTVALAALHGM
ncbi:MAG: DegV family protein [Anaerolineales bacterium]|nr:DegV family protein [Anaerolineales bacterium]